MRILIEVVNVSDGKRNFIYEDHITRYEDAKEQGTIIDMYGEKYSTMWNIDKLINQVLTQKKSGDESIIYQHDSITKEDIGNLIV